VKRWVYGSSAKELLPQAEAMLRISKDDDPNQVTLYLEGSLSGAWVMELEDSWRSMTATPSDRGIKVHLRGVNHVDNAGKYLLALLRYRGVQLSADGIETTELLRDLAQDWPT
jgi:ABC-type transporter Mla MlaB component